jgi:hypothetical protein
MVVYQQYDEPTEAKEGDIWLQPFGKMPLLCKLFGHKWTITNYDNPYVAIRICKRCWMKERKDIK